MRPLGVDWSSIGRGSLSPAAAGGAERPREPSTGARVPANRWPGGDLSGVELLFSVDGSPQLGSSTDGCAVGVDAYVLAGRHIEENPWPS